MVVSSDKPKRNDAPSQSARPRKIQAPKQAKSHKTTRPKAARVSVYQQALDDVRDRIHTLLDHVDRRIATSEAALQRGQAMVDESRRAIELAEREGLHVDRSSMVSMEQTCEEYSKAISEMTTTKDELLRLEIVYKEIEAEVARQEATKEIDEDEKKQLQDSVAQLHDLIGKLAL